MRIYTQLLKFLAVIMGVGVVIAAVISLAILGFGIDFSHAFTKNSSSMYMLLLPFSFLVGIVYLFIVIRRRKEERQYVKRVTEARSEFAKKYDLGNDIDTMIIRTLEKKGPLSTSEIAFRLSIDEDKVKDCIRSLLLTHQIQQRVTNNAAVYVVSREKGENQNDGD